MEVDRRPRRRASTRSAIRRSLSGYAASKDWWWPFWGVLGAAVLLRIAVMAFYTPAVFNYYGGDSARYMHLGFVGINGVFGDNAMPAGYPVFLASLRHLDSWLPLTIGSQHLFGLIGACLLYAAVRTAGATRWAALLPLIVVGLSGDELFIEHGILTEALWLPILALALYLTARSITAQVPRWWLIAGGAMLGASALVRSVSDVLPIVVAMWAAATLPGTAGVRLKNSASILFPAIAVIGAYAVVAGPISGGYTGLFEDSGLSLYGRVGQFADCNKFSPPPGTAPLCSDIPTEERAGPFYWTFSSESPIYSKLHADIHNRHDQQLLSSFAKSAIVHQPVEYAWAVVRDFARFFFPHTGNPRPDSGVDERGMSFESTASTAQAVSPEGLAHEYSEAYTGVGNGVASTSARVAFGGYQEFFRVNGPMLAALIGLTLTGLCMGRGALRYGASLFLVTGLVLLVIPPMFSSYDVRYSIPSINLFSAGAAFGATVIAGRFAGARSGLRVEGGKRSRE